jgi:hypothetical protein
LSSLNSVVGSGLIGLVSIIIIVLLGSLLVVLEEGALAATRVPVRYRQK